MRRQFLYGTVMAAALTVGLGAQSQTPTSSPQYPQDKPQSQSQTKENRGQQLTVVGCLQSGDQSSPTGTTGTATPSPTSKGATGTQFVLSDATESMSGKAGAGATGTAGTTGSSASIPSKLNLTASGSSDSSWSKYLNHKVEVKGTLDHSMSSAPSSPTANPPSATSPSSSDMGATFRVTSIKEVAATCTGSPK